MYRVVNNLGLKKLWEIEAEAEDDDRDNIDDDSPGDTLGMCEVTVGVGVTHCTIPAPILGQEYIFKHIKMSPNVRIVFDLTVCKQF